MPRPEFADGPARGEAETPDPPEASARSSAGRPGDALERVREMLFGDELRRHEATLEAFQAATREQLERVQSLLLAAIETADERWSHRANAIERSLGAQLSELHERITRDGDAHRSERDALESRAAALEAELAATAASLRDAQRAHEEELRTQLLSQGELLSRAIHKHHDAAMAAVADHTNVLRRSKADRDTIAELFLGVAERLTIDP